MSDNTGDGTWSKSRERRLRNRAQRQRATLHRSTLRDRSAYGYGRYYLRLHDGSLIGIEDGGWAVLTLDQVEALLDAGLHRAGQVTAA